MLAFDARQIAADPGVVGLDASEHAVIDMAGGNAPTFSLWQKDCRALRAENGKDADHKRTATAIRR